VILTSFVEPRHSEVSRIAVSRGKADSSSFRFAPVLDSSFFRFAPVFGMTSIYVCKWLER
jgi:hypothetical protein